MGRAAVDRSGAVPVYLEEGATWTFAVALAWPGWARRARSGDAAVTALEDYRSRYRAALSTPLPDGPLEVVGSVPGNRTTDFGAPDARGPWDAEPPSAAELHRQVRLLQDAWAAFDRRAASAPAELRKGPRGGGATRSGSWTTSGRRNGPTARRSGRARRPGPRGKNERAIVATALADGAPGGAWPVGYALRRFAWHVLDHAWEIEDRSG